MIISLLLVGILISPKTEAEVMKVNWGVELPSGYKLLADLESEASFHGDGFRFHLFEYPKHENLEKLFKWEEGPNKIFELKVREILQTLDGAQYLDLFEEGYRYVEQLGKDQSSKLYVMWILKTQQLVIFEEII